jgi:hypothetical protein
MKRSGNSIEKALGEVIEETYEGGNKFTWGDIIEKVKEKLEGEKDKQKVNKFELKKILYRYSVNVPIFSFQEISYIPHLEFKGFRILKEKHLGDQELEDIEKYGIEKICKVNVDEIEIKEFGEED